MVSKKAVAAGIATAAVIGGAAYYLAGRYTLPPGGLTATLSGPPTINLGAAATFTASASGGTPPYVNYAWNFGDGTTLNSTANTQSHSYAFIGPYTVTVTVTDSAAAQASATMQVQVTTTGGPLSVVVNGSTSGSVGQTLSFAATATGGTAPYTYAWNFGDGTPPLPPSAAFNVTHVYSTANTFTVTVTVTDAVHAVASRSLTVVVSSTGFNHGTFLVNSVTGGVFVTNTSTLSFVGLGMTPGALIQFLFGTSTNPAGGLTVVATAVADNSGTAVVTYTLTSGPNDQPGAVFYAWCYDTAIGTLGGYAAPVTITIIP